MTDAPTEATPDAPPVDTRPYSPGLEGVIAGETTLSHVDGDRGAPPVPRLPDRRPRRARHLPGRGRTCCGPASGIRRQRLRHGARPRRGHDRAPGAAAETKPMDALRTAVSAWGATPGPVDWPPTVEQARALTAFSPSALAAFARLRAGPGADRARPVARPRRGVPLPAHRRAAGSRHGPGARCLLHRRRGARLQRLDLHGARHHLDPQSDIASAVTGRDRDDEGTAPRRRAVRGRRPARTRSARPSTPRSGSTRRSTAASG